MQNSLSDYLIWHPYTQMQTAGEPVHIAKGEGALVFGKDGKPYIDAVSSWWTNLYGHSHPYIAAAIAKQAQELEQVIFAGFTHQPAITLAEKLLQHIPFHHKVFYSDNGSTAVEAAIKMALQFWWNKGEKRNKLVAFRDAYHGDTFGSMSVSARGVFTEPYQSLLFDVLFVDTPVKGREEEALHQFSELVKEHSSGIAAFIFEPLVLGSAGMLMYEASVLDRLIAICKANNVFTIADEVFTGFGRTGKFLATDYCEHKPDIVCLSKGITGGFLPFAATTCTREIYNAFLSNEKYKMLFHGHSYTGNPLGCAAAIAGLELFEREETAKQIENIVQKHSAFRQRISKHKFVKEARQAGTIVAVEIDTGEQTGYLNTVRDKAYQYFLERGVILRPLGNVVYVLPPYCITNEQLEEVYSAMESFLEIL